MKKIILFGLSISVIACNGGGGGGSSSGGLYPNVSPYPYPATVGQYLPPPIAALPNFTNVSSSSLQIAYGSQSDPGMVNLAADLSINSSICSATPVSSSGGTTWLVGAAHCFVAGSDGNGSFDIISPSQVRIRIGFNNTQGFESSLVAKAIYIPSNYCAGAAINDFGKCPKFLVTDGGQSNDIALIQADGIIGNPESYPQINTSTSYPPAYTWAPVLSFGYGVSTQVPDGRGKCNGSNCQQLWYVTNYIYQQTDAPGYHFLYNSYFNSSSDYLGYSDLVCGGDSGGGDLFWNGKWLLVSEHFAGPDHSCGQFFNYLPNQSTNVSFYSSWLNGLIANPATCTTANGCIVAN